MFGWQEEEEKKGKEKKKTEAQVKTELEEKHNVSQHMARALEKRADFRQWQVRIQIVEAQCLPVADMAARDANLVGLADPYVTVRVVAADPAKRSKVVHKTAVQYSTLFPRWGQEFRVDFDDKDDKIVCEVWDWDAGKKDDWLGRVEFTGWFFIEGYLEGAPYGRTGVGGGIPSDEAAEQGAIGSPYQEEDWYDILDKRGKKIVNKQYKRAAQMSISFRVDRNFDPVENIERLFKQMFDMKTQMTDALQTGKDALERIRKHCQARHLNVDTVAAHLDADGSNAIDEDELHEGLLKMGIEPPLGMPDVEGVFELMKKLGKLNNAGNIIVKEFAAGISVSDERGLYKTLQRHKQPTMVDIQQLGLTPAAFHYTESHSLDEPGCTCADQWICEKCSTWHRRGTPHFSVAKDQYEEDTECRQCGEPRPSPLPVVPCALLPQEYYRITGNKPKEWKAGSRNSLVVRVQESDSLPIHQDLQAWQVSYKARKMNEQTQADRARREGAVKKHPHQHQHQHPHNHDTEEGAEERIEEMDQEAEEVEESLNQPALLAAPEDEEDDDDGMKHTSHPLKGIRHLLSSHLQTRSMKTGLVGTDGSWQTPLVETPEAEEVEAKEMVIADGPDAGSGGQTKVEGDVWTGMGARGHDDSGVHARRLFGGQDTLDDDEEDRPQTPELALDQLAYLQCMQAETQKRTDGQAHGARMEFWQGSAGWRSEAAEVAADGKDAIGEDGVKAVGAGGDGHSGVGWSGEIDGDGDGDMEGRRAADALDHGSSYKEGRPKTLMEMWAEKRAEVLQRLGLRPATGAVDTGGGGGGGGGGGHGKSQQVRQHGRAGEEKERRVAAAVMPVTEQVVDVRLDTESDGGGLWQVVSSDACCGHGLFVLFLSLLSFSQLYGFTCTCLMLVAVISS